MTEKLSDEQLVEVLKHKRQEEKRIAGEVLELLREVYRRRIHLKRGFDRLSTFLITECEYDDETARREPSGRGAERRVSTTVAMATLSPRATIRRTSSMTSRMRET